MIEYDNDNQSVERAFTKQSAGFDDFEKDNLILNWMRKQVHEHCLEIYKPGEKILELNCGTGIDAIFFAENGLNIFATDVSEGMLKEFQKKIDKKNLHDRITLAQCSFEKLHELRNNFVENQNINNYDITEFDHIYSNFGGLNCTRNLSNVINQFNTLLKPGGSVTMVIMPAICPWELMLAIKGNFKTAFRRLRKQGSPSHLEGENFTTYYYSSVQVTKMFGSNFKRYSLKGLASISPPPYLFNWAGKHSRIYKTLAAIDEKLCCLFPFNSCADHFILTMKKNK